MVTTFVILELGKQKYVCVQASQFSLLLKFKISQKPSLKRKWTVPDCNAPGGPLAFKITQVSMNPHTYMPQSHVYTIAYMVHANKEITKNE